jgi:hypothetical protein
MNQSILFSDDPYWNDNLKQIEFSAQCQGALIICIVRSSLLQRLASVSIDDAADALEQFNQYRFDIEELAEEAIADEQFDADGYIHLS